MTPFIQHQNRQVYIDLFPLVASQLEETALGADVASGASTLTVDSIDGFAIDQILLIGELGKEGSEIIKTNSSTAPTGTTITLASNTTKAHSARTKVYRIEFDQVEISHADTLTGAKSVLATVSIQADQLIQVYTDTTETAGFYFTRYKETIGNTFGGYSDGVPYGGWADTQVGHLFATSLANAGVSLSHIITTEDLFNFTNTGLRFIQGKLRNFPQYQKVNEVIGQTSRGLFRITLPTDIYDNDTPRSIQAVRLGRTGRPLRMLDPTEFENQQMGMVYTQVRTEASAAGTTLEIDNSYDFEDSGTVSVYISGTKYDITYTGVTRSDTAGVLTGIPASGDGAITVTIPVDTFVYQNEVEGEPHYATVRNGNLEIFPLPDSNADNQNVYMSYFTEADQVNSLGDTLDLQRYDMMEDYLTWRIKMKKENSGNLDMSNNWFVMFREKMNDHIRVLLPMFKRKMIPNINRVRYRRFRGRTYDINRDGQ